jgi:hypothetical protein
MSDRISRTAVMVVFAGAAVLYGLQVFTPLRLTTDSIEYLSLADSATRYGLWSALRQPDFPFPKGYPVFLFLIMKSGLFSSAVLVISNLVLFSLGLFFAFRTLLAFNVSRLHAEMACLFTILSFASVKHISQGMSDFLFFALSSSVCWQLTLKHPYRWFGIILCTAAAIEVRFIGLALVAPILGVALSSMKRTRLAIATTSSIAFAMVSVGLVAGHHYLMSFVKTLENGGWWQLAGSAVIAHLQDFGELFANMPLSKIPSQLRVPVLLLGCVAWIIFLVGLIALRKRSAWLCFYLVTYSMLVLPWPYTDPRFWVPVMPFMILSFSDSLVLLRAHTPKGFIVPYITVFSVLGFVALGYSTKLTFAGQHFARQYGDGRLTNAYISRCNTDSIPGENEALVLLQRYEWHCKSSEFRNSRPIN